jgi:hypothetical protein
MPDRYTAYEVIPMMDSTARVIGTLGIWTSFAVVMVFGLCRMSFNGAGALPTFLLAVAMICSAAVIATAFVWRSRSVSAHLRPLVEPPAV